MFNVQFLVHWLQVLLLDCTIKTDFAKQHIWQVQKMIMSPAKNMLDSQAYGDHICRRKSSIAYPLLVWGIFFEATKKKLGTAIGMPSGLKQKALIAAFAMLDVC